jgi:short-subunit dehydrogenase
MRTRFRKLDEQCIVITGASSGIGLVTARLAAARGARVVLAARNQEALRQAAGAIEADGGRAAYVVADVASEDDVARIVETAAERFGGFDTWINNAAVGLYGFLDEVSLEDQRRLFDVNFWGVVHGSRAAVRHLRERGGVLINIGSVLSDRALPMQGVYSAAKHAVKAYTDALRMELEKTGTPISVTLVKPASIDTPYYEHAKNRMDVEPRPPAPVYAPEVVARAILACAERPVRDVIVGGGGKVISAVGILAPRFTDRFMEATQFRAQRSRTPSRDRGDSALYEPTDTFARGRGRYTGHVMQSSAYTTAALHPRATALAAMGVGLALVAGLRALGTLARDDDDED